MGDGGILKINDNYERTVRTLLQRASHCDLFLLALHPNPAATMALLQQAGSLPLSPLLARPTLGFRLARLAACKIRTADESRNLLAGELNTDLRLCFSLMLLPPLPLTVSPLPLAL